MSGGDGHTAPPLDLVDVSLLAPHLRAILFELGGDLLQRRREIRFPAGPAPASEPVHAIEQTLVGTGIGNRDENVFAFDSHFKNPLCLMNSAGQCLHRTVAYSTGAPRWPRLPCMLPVT